MVALVRPLVRPLVKKLAQLADGLPSAPSLSALSLTASSVSEGASVGAVVGQVQGQTSGSTVTLTDTAGGLFDLVDGYIELAGALDYETATFHDVSLTEDHPEVAEPRVTVIRIYVTNVLEVTLAPLSLSASSVPEGSAEDTVVGTVQGLSSGSTWSLTDDAGGRFKKAGNSIVAGTTVTDYEAATSHDITIQEVNADGSNSPRETTLTISVSNVAEVTLGALSLSSSSISEGASNGTVIGQVQGTSAGSSLTLVDDAGGLFSLTGGYLYKAGALDYETATSHTVTIRETHPDAAAPHDTDLTVTVTNVLEVTLAPLSLSAATIEEGAPSGTLVGTIQGGTSGGAFDLVDDAGGRFARSGSNIVAGLVETDYAAAQSHDITVRETHADGANSPRDTVLTISVTEAAGVFAVADQSFTRGRLTAAGAGAYTFEASSGAIASIGSLSGTNASHWQASVAAGVVSITPSSAGDTADLSGGPYTLSLTCYDGAGQTGNSDAVTLTIATTADEYSAATLAEANAAFTAAHPAGGKTIRFVGGTVDTSARTKLAKSKTYSADMTITSESGVVVDGGLVFEDTSGVVIEWMDLQKLTTGYDGVLRFDGDCSNIIIQDNDVHGVYYDPLGDYSASGSYENILGILCSGANSLSATIRRNRIYDIKEGINFRAVGPFSITDNEIFRNYSDSCKVTLEGGGLTAAKEFSRNVMHSFIGDPYDDDNPHIDLFQFIENATNDGQAVTNFVARQNIAWEDSANARGAIIQGIASFGTLVITDAIVSGNVLLLSGNHPVNFIYVDGGTFVNNTLVHPSPTYATTGQAQLKMGGSGSSGSINAKNNVCDGYSLGGAATYDTTGNVTLGVKGASISYATAFDGTDFAPASFTELKSEFSVASGTAGAIGSGYGVYGDVRDEAGWSYVPAYEGGGGSTSAPDAFPTGSWGATTGPTVGSITFAISALPGNGGSAITGLQYSTDSGATWASLGGATTGNYTVDQHSDGETGALAAATSYNTMIRAVNAEGPGGAGVVKPVTTGAASVTINETMWSGQSLNLQTEGVSPTAPAWTIAFRGRVKTLATNTYIVGNNFDQYARIDNTDGDIRVRFEDSAGAEVAFSASLFGGAGLSDEDVFSGLFTVDSAGSYSFQVDGVVLASGAVSPNNGSIVGPLMINANTAAGGGATDLGVIAVYVKPAYDPNWSRFFDAEGNPTAAMLAGNAIGGVAPSFARCSDAEGWNNLDGMIGEVADV